jgi:cytochrome c
MKYVVAASLLSLAGVAAHAATPEELAKSKNCMACHAMDKKMVGPSYKDVAAKYKGQKGAEDKLVQKVLKGGSGTWGPVPMPPNAVSDAEAHTLVKWVLSL